MPVAACRRRALREMLSGGMLHVYVGPAGVLCRRPPRLDSGVIAGGDNNWLRVSVGTANWLRDQWTEWSAGARAEVVRVDRLHVACLIAAGRDVIEVASPRR